MKYKGNAVRDTLSPRSLAFRKSEEEKTMMKLKQIAAMIASSPTFRYHECAVIDTRRAMETCGVDGWYDLPD